MVRFDVHQSEIKHFQTFGFVVFRNAFDAGSLRDELDQALHAGSGRSTRTGVAEVQYLPMMSRRTPCSLSLLDRFEKAAAALLEGPVLPVRAKGMHYFGSTSWHTDSSRPVASVGFAAYLDPLNVENGALRVLPGSHRGEYGSIVAAYLTSLAPGAAIESLPAVAVATEPGDVIAFDEHLCHASSGGIKRRQWRADYVRDPVSATEEEEVRAYFAHIFAPEWDGGHDVDAFPSYSPEWIDSARPAVMRLRELGVFELAAQQENFARSRRTLA
ncbi:MAG: hypothetical protein JWN04_716 [Myxococcaceae bacterium]|nr:hypothetical protein [Myxococcaceae bacterium]